MSPSTPFVLGCPMYKGQCYKCKPDWCGFLSQVDARNTSNTSLIQKHSFFSLCLIVFPITSFLCLENQSPFKREKTSTSSILNFSYLSLIQNNWTQPQPNSVIFVWLKIVHGKTLKKMRPLSCTYSFHLHVGVLERHPVYCALNYHPTDSIEISVPTQKDQLPFPDLITLPSPLGQTTSPAIILGLPRNVCLTQSKAQAGMALMPQPVWFFFLTWKGALGIFQALLRGILCICVGHCRSVAVSCP